MIIGKRLIWLLRRETVGQYTQPSDRKDRKLCDITANKDRNQILKPAHRIKKFNMVIANVTDAKSENII